MWALNILMSANGCFVHSGALKPKQIIINNITSIKTYHYGNRANNSHIIKG